MVDNIFVYKYAKFYVTSFYTSGVITIIIFADSAFLKTLWKHNSWTAAPNILIYNFILLIITPSFELYQNNPLKTYSKKNPPYDVIKMATRPFLLLVQLWWVGSDIFVVALRWSMIVHSYFLVAWDVSRKSLSSHFLYAHPTA